MPSIDRIKGSKKQSNLIKNVDNKYLMMVAESLKTIEQKVNYREGLISLLFKDKFKQLSILKEMEYQFKEMFKIPNENSNQFFDKNIIQSQFSLLKNELSNDNINDNNNFYKGKCNRLPNFSLSSFYSNIDKNFQKTNSDNFSFNKSHNLSLNTNIASMIEENVGQNSFTINQNHQNIGNPNFSFQSRENLNSYFMKRNSNGKGLQSNDRKENLLDNLISSSKKNINQFSIYNSPTCNNKIRNYNTDNVIKNNLFPKGNFDLNKNSNLINSENQNKSKNYGNTKNNSINGPIHLSQNSKAIFDSSLEQKYCPFLPEKPISEFDDTLIHDNPFRRKTCSSVISTNYFDSTKLEKMKSSFIQTFNNLKIENELIEKIKEMTNIF